MNWKQIITELNERGLSEHEIARRLKREGVEITQASINRLKQEHIKQPRFDVGTALLQLHRESGEMVA